MEDDRFVLRSITDEIMYELMLLSGQEYVDDVRHVDEGPHRRAPPRSEARELQEAALPGSAAKELEEALDAAEGVDGPAGVPPRRRPDRRRRG